MPSSGGADFPRGDKLLRCARSSRSLCANEHFAAYVFPWGHVVPGPDDAVFHVGLFADASTREQNAALRGGRRFYPATVPSRGVAFYGHTCAYDRFLSYRHPAR